MTNLEFYKRNLKEVLDKLLGDTNGQESDPDADNPFAFKNERPPSVLGLEREVYEALCRGETSDESNVFNFISF